jgi:hypothetical protein
MGRTCTAMIPVLSIGITMYREADWQKPLQSGSQ